MSDAPSSTGGPGAGDPGASRPRAAASESPDLPDAQFGFRDRAEAGAMLARALEDYRGRDCIVLGLPRGGVEVGAAVASRLGAPLDVLLVRKLPAPPQPELAIGAVADGPEPVRVLDEQRTRALGLSAERIEAIVQEQLAEVRRRAEIYRGARPAEPIRGRVAIVVDDGVATGSTAEAALRVVRAAGPAELILAVPVGATDALESLGSLCDRVICLLAPRDFHAVGVYYGSFAQVDDRRVIDLLSGGR